MAGGRSAKGDWCLDYVERTTCLRQRCQRLVDVLISVIGGDREANPARGRRHGRWANRGGIDSQCEQCVGEAHRAIGIADDDWKNGALRSGELEAEAAESLRKAMAIPPQSGSPLRLLPDHAERRRGGRGGGRCGGGCIGEGAAGIHEIGYEFG